MLYVYIVKGARRASHLKPDSPLAEIENLTYFLFHHRLLSLLGHLIYALLKIASARHLSWC